MFAFGLAFEWQLGFAARQTPNTCVSVCARVRVNRNACEVFRFVSNRGNDYRPIIINKIGTKCYEPIVFSTIRESKTRNKNDNQTPTSQHVENGRNC